MLIVAIFVVALLVLAAYAVLWMTWQTGKVAVNGMKWIVNDHDRHQTPEMMDNERRMHERLAREKQDAKENSPYPSPVIKEDGLSKALRESATRKVKENSLSPLPVTLDSENDTAAQKGWLFPEGMTTQYRPKRRMFQLECAVAEQQNTSCQQQRSPRFTWKASDTREEVQESEEWLLRL